MYELYMSYGANVGLLFVTGFASSAIFGTFLGVYVNAYIFLYSFILVFLYTFDCVDFVD